MTDSRAEQNAQADDDVVGFTGQARSDGGEHRTPAEVLAETPLEVSLAEDADDLRDVVAFVGDSITEGGSWSEWFPDVRTLNFGRGGDTTDHVLERLDEVIAAQPDEIVVLVGTNDLGLRQTVEHLVRNTETICVNLRRALPGSRMLVQSVMPRGREYASRIQEANIHLRQFASTVHAQFLDLWPTMALDDGELNPLYTDDRLHLSSAGYEAWLGELRPGLVRLRELPPMTTPIQIIRPLR